MQNRHQQFERRSRLWWSGFKLLAAVTTVAVAIANLNGAGTDRAPTASFATEQVRLARFIKTVRMAGDVRTFQPAFAANDCRYYPLRIVELASEGSWVEKGDVVCVLDSSVLRDRLNEQRIQLIRAEAGLATAEVRASMQELANDRRLSVNSSRLALARQKLATFEYGESINTIQKLGDEVMIKEDALETAHEDYARTEFLTALGYNSAAQFDVARARMNNAQTTFDRAEGALRLSDQFQHPRNLFELQAQSELAEQEMRRTHLQNDLATAGSKVVNLEFQQGLAGIQNYVDYLTRSIDACTIVAPKTGELIYCHRSDQGKFIEVGSFVHYTQDIIRIANRSRMMFAGRVQDTRVYEISTGQSATINVLNLPDQEYHGTLRWISPIPAPASWFLPENLYHNVQIDLEDDPESCALIALGATADAEVVVDDRFDVVQVPTRAVFSHQNSYSVIVQCGNGIECRVVELGSSNDLDVEVLSGVNPGEVVLVESPHVLRKLANRPQ